MRLFVALVPPSAPCAALEADIAAIREARPQLRWTPRQEWHVTLAFCPDVPTHDVADLCAAVGDAVATLSAPDLRLQGGGAFPTPRRARVLWAGVRGATAADDTGLAHLAERVRDRTAAYADLPETFHPHVTVARTRARSNERGVVDGLRSHQGRPWRQPDVRVIESRPGKGPGDRPAYQTLEPFTLIDSG